MLETSKIRQIPSMGIVLRSLEGVTQWRAMAMMIGSMLLALLLIFLMASTGSAVLIGLGTLIAYVAGWAGFSGAGFMLMQHARQESKLSFQAAFFKGLFSLPGLLGATIVIWIGLFALFVVEIAFYFLCKIPLLGPLLFALGFPAFALITAAALLITSAMLYLAAPAFWEGLGFREVLARIWLIARKRLLPVLLQFLVLGIACFVAGLLLFGILFGGATVTSMLAGTILDIQGFSGISAMLMGAQFEGTGASSGYMMGLGLGWSILIALAATAPLSMFLYGQCLIYLEAKDGLDFSQASAAINQVSERMRQKMQAVQNTVASQPQTQTAGNPPATQCPQCGSSVGVSDSFCGECGQRLQ